MVGYVHMEKGSVPDLGPFTMKLLNGQFNPFDAYDTVAGVTRYS